MKEEHIINLDNIACFLYGDRHSENWLIQPVDDHDLEGMDNEVSVITELTGNTDFCLITFKVRNWNTDLSPWKAPAVFGNADFGDGARTIAKTIRGNGSGHTENVSWRVLISRFVFSLDILPDGYFYRCCRGIAVGLVSWMAGLCQGTEMFVSQIIP